MTDGALSSDLRAYFGTMPVVVEDEPNACRIEFAVGNQHFCIGPDYVGDADEAEWFIGMFVKALERVIDDRMKRVAETTRNGAV